MVDTEEAFLWIAVDCLLGILDTAEGFLETADTDTEDIPDIFLSPWTGQPLPTPECSN